MDHAEIEEIIKCRDDISYFANNYIKIEHALLGIVQIELNNFQQNAIQKYNTEKKFYIHADRIEGKTTVAAIILLHQALFTDSRVSCIFADGKSASDAILSIIKFMYNLLPEYLKITKITNKTKGKIEFDNYCSIISAGQNTDYARGRAISNVYIDESEWVKNVVQIINDLYPSMATLPYTRLFSFSSSRISDKFRELNLK